MESQCGVCACHRVETTTVGHGRRTVVFAMSAVVDTTHAMCSYNLLISVLVPSTGPRIVVAAYGTAPTRSALQVLACALSPTPRVCTCDSLWV